MPPLSRPTSLAAATASLAAAALWGLFPVLIAIATLTPGAEGPAFAVWVNAAGGLVALLAALILRPRAWTALRAVLGRRSGCGLLAMNAGFIALANTLAFRALAEGGRNLSALILDASPLPAARILPLVVPGYTRWRWTRVPALALAAAGFTMMHDAGAAALGTIAIAITSTLCQVATVCLHQRLIAHVKIQLDAWGMLALQGARMILASAAALPIAVFWGTSSALLSPTPGALLTAVVAGLLIAASALLSTWSLERSRAPALALAWLLAPAFTISLLAALGLDHLSPTILGGSALIIAALAWDHLARNLKCGAR
mgnify:FL=1